MPNVLHLVWIIAKAASAFALLPTSASLASIAGLLQLCEAVSTVRVRPVICCLLCALLSFSLRACCFCALLTPLIFCCVAASACLLRAYDVLCCIVGAARASRGSFWLDRLH